MADNVTVSNSSSSSNADYAVASDEVAVGGTQAAAQVQFVKLVDGTLNGTSPIPGGSSGLKVDLTSTGANATALKVDGSAVTQPVSAASLPLPSGAATAAKQPALGTAGTPSADVISVQGVTSMTALKVDGSAVTQPVSAGSLPLPTGAATSAKQPALGTAGTPSADVISVQGVTSMTALKVDGSAVTQPVSAGSLPLPTGASTAAKQPALGTAGTASADVITVQGIASMTALKVDGSAVTQPVSGTVTANVTPATSGGLSISRTLSAATTNATSVKASAGQVFGWYLYNANAAARYLKLYNKASAPTVGTDTPVMTIPLVAGGAANVEFTNGVAFGTGIALAITTGVADSDTGAVAANEIIVNLLYK